MSIGLDRYIPPVTRNLLIINFIIWLAELALPRVGIDLVQLFGMRYMGSDRFEWYQLVTHMFLHDPKGIGHLFSNMFGLFMFGGLLEHVWGQRRFLIYYFVTGMGAGLIQQLAWHLSMTPEMLLFSDYLLVIGASGAIFGVLLAFGMMFPNMPVYIIFVPIPIKAKWLVIGYGLLELFSGLFTTGSGVAHFAHLGGMLFGYFLIRYWQKEAKKKQGNEWQDFY